MYIYEIHQQFVNDSLLVAIPETCSQGFNAREQMLESFPWGEAVNF